MKVYVARENATEFGLEDVMLGVYYTKAAALKSCNDQRYAWDSTWDQEEYMVSYSGWNHYTEINAGGWSYETTIKYKADVDNAETTLFHVVYEMEVQ